MVPVPPRELAVPSSAQTGGYLAYALALAFLPGALGWLLVTFAPHPAALLACIPLWIVAGYGFFMLAGTAHEGFHFNLHRNHLASALLGISFSSAVPGFVAVGFHLSHWEHHRYTNTARDPDVLQFVRYRSWWSRAFCARVSANADYLAVALRALLRRGRQDHHSTLTAPQLKRLVLVNFAAQLLWIAAYAALFLLKTRIAVIAVIVPLLFTFVITGLNPYQEHAGTGISPHDVARSRSSPLFTYLMLGTNYHLEHHLYPGVPCWRLPGLHRWLRVTDWYRGQAIRAEPGFWGSFTTALSSRWRYGPPSVGSEADPAARSAAAPMSTFRSV